MADAKDPKTIEETKLYFAWIRRTFATPTLSHVAAVLAGMVLAAGVFPAGRIATLLGAVPGRPDWLPDEWWWRVLTLVVFLGMACLALFIERRTANRAREIIASMLDADPSRAEWVAPTVNFDVDHCDARLNAFVLTGNPEHMASWIGRNGDTICVGVSDEAVESGSGTRYTLAESVVADGDTIRVRVEESIPDGPMATGLRLRPVRRRSK